jgi:AraC-like DNA-binding protein
MKTQAISRRSGIKNNSIVKNKKIGLRKEQNRELIININMFLLAHEQMKNQFWNVKSVVYKKSEQIIEIGINTTKGKLGTTLTNLRKISKYLSDHLYDTGLTFRKAKIVFFVDKQDEESERLMSLIGEIEKNLINNQTTSA